MQFLFKRSCVQSRDIRTWVKRKVRTQLCKAWVKIFSSIDLHAWKYLLIWLGFRIITQLFKLYINTVMIKMIFECSRYGLCFYKNTYVYNKMKSGVLILKMLHWFFCPQNALETFEGSHIWHIVKMKYVLMTWISFYLKW